MFEDWKKAWQEAVTNFQRELADDDGEEPGPAQLAAMRRDLNAARRALDRLQLDLQQCGTEITEEEKQEQVCRRRGDLAAGIGDQETVRLAVQWSERHRQRVVILRQKADVLAAELALRTHDLDTMDAQMKEVQKQLGVSGSPGPPPPKVQTPERTKQDAEFRRLDREAREKAAEARLEELKKRMR